MNWNPVKGNWTAPEGKTKRPSERLKDNEPNVIGERDNHESQTPEIHLVNQEKADKHLANLHDLLKNMPDFGN